MGHQPAIGAAVMRIGDPAPRQQYDQGTKLLALCFALGRLHLTWSPIVLGDERQDQCRGGAMVTNAVSGAPERHKFIENRLLSFLSTEECARLLPHLRPVRFSLGEVIYEPGGPLEYGYFPTTCVVSLIYTMESGSTAEMGLVGNDGVVGVALFLGGDSTPNRAIVQIAGDAFRFNAKALREEFARGGAATFVAALHAGIDYSDFADGGLQPPPLRRRSGFAAGCC